ncbi:hypothetical protein GON05_33280 [Paenibacillus sp. MAH-34]|uniref:Uncharacterized protein n=2 Tax=Paenibacillus TaxID=44249 RepID=A0ABW9ULT2_9BACL|nr:hypothetical protein [Paenibacillus anseongense]
MELKQEEERLRLLKNLIREEQDSLDLKRIVWAELGVVGEFQNSIVYEYDHDELNALLYNIGILPVITCIKSSDLTEEELGRVAHVPAHRKRYLRFTPSNHFKQSMIIPLFDFNVNELDLLDKVAMWKESNTKFERLNTIWQIEKLRALVSLELKTSKKLTFECGTFSFLEGSKKYRTDMVLEHFDVRTIIRCARVNLDRMDEIRSRGFLSKHELAGIRRVVNVQRRYIIMTIKKEKMKKEYWCSKLKQLSHLSQGENAE